MMLGLLFCQEARECDDVCIDLRRPGPGQWRVTIGSRCFGSHCLKVDTDCLEDQKRRCESNRKKVQ
jgi:hypothetical protein